MTDDEPTPGPWEAEFWDDEPVEGEVTADGVPTQDFYIYADFEGDKDRVNVRPGDLRLIAAAPDMKAENENLREENGQLRDTLEECKEVLVAIRSGDAPDLDVVEETIDNAANILEGPEVSDEHNGGD